MAELNVHLDEQFGDGLLAHLDRARAVLATGVQTVAADRRTMAALREADRERLLADWGPFFGMLREKQVVSHLYFLDREGFCLLRVHKPDEFGDRIERQPTRSGAATSGIEVGRFGNLALRAAKPVFAGGELVGYVELGNEIGCTLDDFAAFSETRLVATMSKSLLERKSWEASMLRLGRSPDWELLVDRVVVYSSHPEFPGEFSRFLGDSSEVGGMSARVDIGGRFWHLASIVLRDTSGTPVARLAGATDITAGRAAYRRSLVAGGVFAAILLTAMLGILLAFVRRAEKVIRRRESELRDAGEMYRLLAANTQMGLALHEIVLDEMGRPVDYVFLDANRAFAKHTGLDVATIVGRRVTEVLPGIEKTPFIDLYGKVATTGEGVSFEQFSEPLGRHYLVVATQIGAGRFATFFEDITDRKRAEDTLRASEDRFRSLAANLPGLVCEFLPDSTLTYVNRAYAETFDLSPEELTGRQFLDFVPEAQREVVRQQYLSLSPANPRRTYTHRVVRKGEVGLFEWQDQALFDDRGNPLFFCSIGTDITERDRLEAARQRLQMQLSLAQGIASLGSWEYAVAEDRLLWSEETFRIFGIDPAGFQETYRAFLATIHPEDRPPVEAAYARSLQDPSFDYEIEHRMVRQDTGEERLVHEKCLHVRDEDGNVVQSFGTVQDITERKRAEAALLESEQRNRAILASLPDLIFIVDREGVFLDYSAADETLLLMPPGEFLGRSIREILPPEVAEEATRLSGEALRTGITQACEYRLASPPGSSRDYESRVAPLGEDRTLFMVRDITPRKEMERQLEKAEERQRLILESLPSGIIAADAKTGEFLYANGAMCRMLGYSREEMLSLSVEKLHPPEELFHARAGFGKTAGGASAFIETACVRKDGSVFPVAVYGEAVELQGRPCALGTFMDISELVRAGQALEEANRFLEQRVEERTAELAVAKQVAEQANRAKSDFLANMSHELRNPLHSVIGFAEALEERYFGDLNERQTQYVRYIVEGGRHLLGLVNEVLDLSKVEAGKMTLDAAAVDIVELLEGSLAMFGETCARRRIGLASEVAADLRDVVVSADARKVKQVLFNLLSNAVKFTPDGGGIRVEAHLAGEGADRRVEVSVTDTGCGVPADCLDSLFEPFYQIETEVLGKAPGTGLGLPLSRKLVELHGGELSLVSEGEEKGCTARFWLPAAAMSRMAKPGDANGVST